MAWCVPWVVWFWRFESDGLELAGLVAWELRFGPSFLFFFFSVFFRIFIRRDKKKQGSKRVSRCLGSKVGRPVAALLLRYVLYRCVKKARLRRKKSKIKK
ncbi:unnamed protein product [Laminaria digitata]